MQLVGKIYRSKAPMRTKEKVRKAEANAFFWEENFQKYDFYLGTTENIKIN